MWNLLWVRIRWSLESGAESSAPVKARPHAGIAIMARLCAPLRARLFACWAWRWQRDLKKFSTGFVLPPRPALMTR